VAAVTWRPALDEGLRDAYLRRLGWPAPPEPTLETLFALHRAQVERVPYECVWVWLGERRTIEPLDAVRYVTAGRGGYCYHMNGSLSALLTWLGFDVHWRFGGVQGGPNDPIGPNGNHLVLEVNGLPSPANPEGRWLVDTGLGDGLHEPLPLMPGEYQQGPFTYRLSPSDGGWRLDADPRMSLLRVDWAANEASQADFAAKHAHLSSSPDSGFVRVCAAFRRDGGGWDVLRGCVLKRFDPEESTRELTSRAEWFAALADVFGLPLSDVDDSRRAALWEKVRAAHEAFLAKQAQ
jgi:arylamine N-acetyltransferase